MKREKKGRSYRKKEEGRLSDSLEVRMQGFGWIETKEVKVLVVRDA